MSSPASEDFPDSLSETLTQSSTPSPQAASSSSTSQTSHSGDRFAVPQNHYVPPTNRLPRVEEQGSGENGHRSKEDPVDGWPYLAYLMASKPDLESFSRFKELNIKSLLYYQVQLEVLKGNLSDIEGADWDRCRRAPPGSQGRLDYAKNAQRLVRSKNSSVAEERKQWEKVVEIRECLKEYNAALLQYHQVRALPEPRPMSVEFLRDWITQPGQGISFIYGKGMDTWGALVSVEKIHKPVVEQIAEFLKNTFVFWKKRPCPSYPDLVSMQAPVDVDGLTGWIEDEAVPFYQGIKLRLEQNKHKDDLEKIQNHQQEEQKADGRSAAERLEERLGSHTVISENMILKATSAIVTITACVLPTVAIAVLTTAHGLRDKLLYIGGLTMLFAIGLMILANESSRTQIFVGTCGFSAVLVVFVQGQ
ncbi:hypothetical protein MKZ38_003332 [Zalerion maritima]|uniref:DUF6594 domain-containing protein n=1 Tax=Zalerion maritima TaxID=339359 RepID=A0AAD5RP45_9PEZI|nr:hypothetical protein MKZ38_003332 [Zalerion maritima]